MKRTTLFQGAIAGREARREVGSRRRVDEQTGHGRRPTLVEDGFVALSAVGGRSHLDDHR